MAQSVHTGCSHDVHDDSIYRFVCKNLPEAEGSPYTLKEKELFYTSLGIPR